MRRSSIMCAALFFVITAGPGASSVIAGQQFLAPRQFRVGARLEF